MPMINENDRQHVAACQRIEDAERTMPIS
jgi:hypothetical protein